MPPRFNVVRDVVEALAEDPGRAALSIVDAEGVIDRSTFARIAGVAAQWAQLLALVGIQPRDRVVIAVGAADWHPLYLGTLKLGAIPVVTPRDAPVGIIADRAATAGARLLLTDDAAGVATTGTQVPILALDDARPRLGTLARIAPTFDTSATDPAAIVFSEDPTRERPTAVVHAHAAAFGARAIAEHWLSAGPGDVLWCTAPLGSPEFLWFSVCGAWGVGAESVSHAAPFDPVERLDLIDRLGVTVLCQPADEYDALLEVLHGRRHTSRLRHAVVLGAVSAATVEEFRAATGLTLLAGHSTIETGLLLAHEIGDDPASLGRPASGLDVCVVDFDGRELPAGSEGEIAVRNRPATLFTGFWRAPAETEAVFLGDTYLTGLRGVTAADGAFEGRGTAPMRELAAPAPPEPAALEEAVVEPEEPAVFEITPIGDPEEALAAAALAAEAAAAEEARRHAETESRAAERQRRREEEDAERRAREEAARAEREAAEERKRIEAEERAARKAEEVERKRLAAEARAAEKARQQEERRQAKAAEAERKRAEAEARDAEKKREEEERARSKAAQKAEAARERTEAEAQTAEERRLAQEQAAEEMRLAEERRLAEARRLEEARRQEAEERAAAEARAAEERAAEERRVAEERRLVEEAEAERRRAEAQAEAEARARAAEEERLRAEAEAEAAAATAARTPTPEEGSREDERTRRGWRRRRPEAAEDDLDDEALDAEAQRITASLIERLSAFSHEGPARPSETNGHEDRGAEDTDDEEQTSDPDRA